MRKDSRTRSHLPLRRVDLERLRDLAVEDRLSFLRRHEDWGRAYSGRVLCVALCQGAAMHYLNPGVGINDFDVYTFYAANPARRWYANGKLKWILAIHTLGALNSRLEPMLAAWSISGGERFPNIRQLSRLLRFAAT